MVFNSACKGLINRLTPNDPYMGRIAPLTSKRCILYIYSTNIIIIISNLSNDRSKASSKTIPPHSAI